MYKFTKLKTVIENKTIMLDVIIKINQCSEIESVVHFLFDSNNQIANANTYTCMNIICPVIQGHMLNTPEILNLVYLRVS